MFWAAFNSFYPLLLGGDVGGRIAFFKPRLKPTGWKDRKESENSFTFDKDVKTLLDTEDVVDRLNRQLRSLGELLQVGSGE